MSTETREKAVRALVAAIDETMAEVRQGPFSTPAPGQRTKLADLSPSAALLLEGVAPGVSRVVVRLSAPYVAHIEVPSIPPGPAPGQDGASDFRGSLIAISQSFEMDEAALAAFADEAPNLVKKAVAKMEEQRRARMMQEMAAIWGEVPPWGPPDEVAPVVPAAPSKRGKRGA